MAEFIEAFSYHFTYYLFGGSFVSFLYLMSSHTVRKYYDTLFKMSIFLAFKGILCTLLFGHLTSLYLISPVISLFLIQKMENNFKIKNSEMPKDVSFWYLKNEKKQPKHIYFQQKIGLILFPISMSLFFLLLILELLYVN